MSFARFATLISLFAMRVWAQTNSFVDTPSNQPQRAREIRWNCIQNRRIICGKILKVIPDGIVVDSGYTNLMRPPFNRWLVPGTVKAEPAANLVEGKYTDAICVGLVFVTDLPKKPAARLFDYVRIEGFPAGRCIYTSVGNVRRTIRRFTPKLENAVQWQLNHPE